MQVGIVILPDDETSERARAHSAPFGPAPHTLAVSGRTPYISIAHMHVMQSQLDDTISCAKYAVEHVTLPPYCMGELSTITRTCEKWITWNVLKSDALHHIQTEVHALLRGRLSPEDLNRECPHKATRHDPHIILASSAKQPSDLSDICAWCGEKLAVVTLGDYGEIIDVLFERDIYAPQVMHLLTHVLPSVARMHARYAHTEAHATRRHDKRTPYGIHPTLAASLILHERSLSRKERLFGALTLAYHDIPEDTTAPLPSELPSHVIRMINDMCFDSFTHEMEAVWSRSSFIRMCKLYDKFSNLYDTDMGLESLARYVSYTHALAESVRDEYPDLVIHALINAITARLKI